MLFDAIVIGAGHNGLTAAAYLAKQSFRRVLVLEKRSIIGGAAVTEEIVNGFKFSRCSYLAGLLRPGVIKELHLKEHGLKLLHRPHHSFTPSLLHKNESLLMSNDMSFTQREIAKFSEKDAIQYPLYCQKLTKFANVLDSLIDSVPPQISAVPSLSEVNLKEHIESLKRLYPAMKGLSEKNDVSDFVSLLLSPAQNILDEYFESEILKATLATDAVIGAMVSPQTPGSGYVLLHHVMNGGNWSYVEGGMGNISNSIWKEADRLGVEVRVNSDVGEIMIDEKDGSVSGVRLTTGEELCSNIVLR